MVQEKVYISGKSSQRVVPLVWVLIVSLGVIAIPWRWATMLAVGLFALWAWSELVPLYKTLKLYSSNKSAPEAFYKAEWPWLAEFLVIVGFTPALTSIRYTFGWRVMALVVFMVFIGDVAGWCAGKGLGKLRRKNQKLVVRHPWMQEHKLASRVSPGKTWEGAVGDVVLGFGFGWLIVWLLGIPLSWWQLAVLAVVILPLGILGDLNESLIKRMAGQDNSGTILREHGGILDRNDALMVASVAAWVMLHILI